MHKCTTSGRRNALGNRRCRPESVRSDGYGRSTRHYWADRGTRVILLNIRNLDYGVGVAKGKSEVVGEDVGSRFEELFGGFAVDRTR